MQAWQKTVYINLAACVALLCLLLPATAQASEKTGIYVTPKVNVGFMNWQPGFDADAQSGTWKTPVVASMDKGGFSLGVGTRRIGDLTHGGAGSFDFSSGKNSTLWGGALAVGYDFYPRFDLPLRLELEYGMYSNASGSSGGGGYATSPQLIGQIIGDGKSAGRSALVRDIDIKLQNIQTLLLNAYWDFHNSTNFTPYIGAGIGLAFIQAQGSGTAYLSGDKGHNGLYPLDLGIKNNTNFAWQVGAGCSYAFTDTIALDLGYRFMGLGSVETNSISRTDVNDMTSDLRITNMRGKGEAKDIYMHQISLGLRISF